MPPRIDITGKKFGRWVVLNPAPPGTLVVPAWFCRCDCGVERVVASRSLRNGASKSCGCLKAEKNRKPRATVAARLIALSEKEPNGCRTWVGSTNADGYASLSVNGRYVGAHRAAWVESNGPIPAGMQIDHMCGNRACIEVTHLNIVTPKSNKQFNSRLRGNNTTGYRGVSFNKQKGAFVAYLRVEGKRMHLGYFPTAEEAGIAAESARREAGYYDPTPILKGTRNGTT